MGVSDLADAMTQDSRILMGKIAGALGLKGEVRLVSFTADPAGIAGYGPLLAEDGRRIELSGVRPVKDGLAARVKGVSDRTAAEALRGLALYLPRAALPPADEAEDEFYVADLIGLLAVDEAGAELGKVTAVPNYGAGDLVEISGPWRGLLPFTRDVVTAVDMAAKRIVVRLPAEVTVKPHLVGPEDLA